jgi:RND family efflux transporter MFP subunit
MYALGWIRRSLIAYGLVVLAGCGAGGNQPDKAKAEKASAKRGYKVRTATVGTQSLVYEMETTGSLEAQDVFRIDAQVPGVVEGVSFKEGNPVTPKTVLCRIAPTVYELNAQRAKDAWQTAKDACQKAVEDLEDIKRKTRNDANVLQLKFEQLDRDLARYKPSFDAGAVSQDGLLLWQDKRDMTARELRNAQEAAVTMVRAIEAAAKQKDSEAKQAETAYKQALDDLRRSAVTPPVSGTIDQRLISDGTHVNAGTPIAVLVGPGLKLRFELPEKDSVHIAAESLLKFQVLAYPEKEFVGKIYYISNIADPKTRLVTCWANVNDAGSTLKAGFYATVKLITSTTKEAAVIPIGATLPTEYGFVVFCVEDGKAKRRLVTLGLQVQDKAVEIIRGLKSGETIVVQGANALQDGVPVEELESKDKK